MGLTTWKGAKVRRVDITVAKNYLTEKELKSLNRIVTMYLDYAKEQAGNINCPVFVQEMADSVCRIELESLYHSVSLVLTTNNLTDLNFHTILMTSFRFRCFSHRKK